MLTKEEMLFQQRPSDIPVGSVHSGTAKSSSVNGYKKGSSGSKMHNTNHSCLYAKYVHSRVTLYYNSRIELKWRRSLHHCQFCDIGETKGVPAPCGSIHYGICTPVLSRPSTTSSPFSTSSSSSSSPSENTARPRTSIAVSQPTSSVTSSQSPGWEPTKTITNGAPSKDKESLSSRESTTTTPQIDKDSRKEKENQKQTSNLNFQLSNHVTLDTNANAITEEQFKSRASVSIKPSRTGSQANVNIPRFYFPTGKPVDLERPDEVLQVVSQEFDKGDDGKLLKHQFAAVAKACNLPLYWKCPLYMAAGGMKQGHVTFQMFSTMWRKMSQAWNDRASKFVMMLAKPGTNYLEEEDVMPLIQDVVDTHPGLTFLQEAPEFHSRYVNTVIARIMYCVNRSWSGKITIQELRKSNFLQVLHHIEEEDDINQVMEYFSYEHFYVIYCKFWELDKDHDLFIDRSDLARHNAHAISSKMIDRIFSGAVTRGTTFQDGKMSYPEFVWFLMAEEDKRHPTSVEYWFRCMDLDGDGVISMYEMEYFYEEQMQKMEALGIERLPFEDCLCQMIDLVRPVDQEKITLSDLKRCKLTNIYFDTFFNLDKFLEHEQRDPFSNMRDLDSDVPEPTDWERYAAEEYEYLVAEEGANEQEEIHYEDDFEPEEEEVGGEETTESFKRPGDPVQHGTGSGASHTGDSTSPRSHNVKSLRQVDDDIYDFSHA